MKSEFIRGKTLQWTFSDGPMANRTFEHSFKNDGSVSFRSLDGKGDGKLTEVSKCEAATVGPDVYSASYLGPSGHTLTVVLDYRTGAMVAFASNERDLVLQHGTFHEVQSATNGPRTSAPGRLSSTPRA
jgi:hypothetical protein